MRCIREALAEGREVRALAQVVGFLVQLRARLGEVGGEVEAPGQKPREPHQRAHVRHVAVDRAGDARVLDLDRHVAPVAQPRAVDLPDRGGGNGREVETPERRLPLLAERGVEDLRDIEQQLDRKQERGRRRII